MTGGPFFFLALAELSATQAACVLVCLCVATAAAVGCAVRWMAREDDRARDEFWSSEERWPVGKSNCEDPER